MTIKMQDKSVIEQMKNILDPNENERTFTYVMGMLLMSEDGRRSMLHGLRNFTEENIGYLALALGTYVDVVRPIVNVLSQCTEENIREIKKYLVLEALYNRSFELSPLPMQMLFLLYFQEYGNILVSQEEQGIVLELEINASNLSFVENNTYCTSISISDSKIRLSRNGEHITCSYNGYVGIPTGKKRTTKEHALGLQEILFENIMAESMGDVGVTFPTIADCLTMYGWIFDQSSTTNTTKLDWLFTAIKSRTFDTTLNEQHKELLRSICEGNEEKMTCIYEGENFIAVHNISSPGSPNLLIFEKEEQELTLATPSSEAYQRVLLSIKLQK